VFLSKIIGYQSSFSNVLRRIDLFKRLESSAKIRSKHQVLVVADIADQSLQSLSDFAFHKTSYREMLIKNITFYQPGNLLKESTNVREHYKMYALLTDVMLSYGYSLEKSDEYNMHVFAESFQNTRRKQVNSIFKEFTKDKWVELSKHLSEMEKDHSIPKEYAIRMKLSLLSEGFTLKIFGPRMNEHEEARFRQKINRLYEIGFNAGSAYDIYDQLIDETESYGYGLILILRILRDIHPGFYYNVENKGKHAVTEITLPRIGHE